MNRRTRASILAVLISATALLSGCSSTQPAPEDALAIGTGIPVEVGAGVEMSFAIDDVRQGEVSDLSAMGVQTPSSVEGKTPYFVTYSITLTDGDIADADRDALPVPAAEDWTLHGDGAYEPMKVYGQFDCTKDGSGSNAVSPDAPLVGCQVFLGKADALPTAVEVKDRGVWTTKD
ncbi:MAG TPA: hypothetical protein VNJ54_06190 [Plantibacter sp.]|uniref:hypothetical protein n=1 Tax=unclassified Plantibacter TaxID=2624265 RepID=UPI002C4C65E1|nr:hypothetical protein [Plantibacter sp.]